MSARQHARQRDAEATKAAILDAAEIEFARAGLMGARTENIAEHSGVTRGMIHYYYDSKEKLYQEVLERAFARQLATFRGMDLSKADPLAALESLVGNLMDDIAKDPNIPIILMHEGLQNQGKYYKDLAIATIYEPLRLIFERGMNEGRFRKLDPVQASINVVGMCVFYAVSRNNLRHLFPPGSSLFDPEIFQGHVQETLITLRRAYVA